VLFKGQEQLANKREENVLSHHHLTMSVIALRKENAKR
jgi:hypothetical protein